MAESGEYGRDDEQAVEQWSEQRRRAAAAALLALLLVVVSLIVLPQLFGRVPSTLGMSARGAQARLLRAGFRSEVTTVAAGARLAGRVVAQAPAQGVRPRGYVVGISVTSGPVVLAYRPVGHTSRANYDLTLKGPAAGEREIMPHDAEEMDALYQPQRAGAPRVMPNVLGRTRPAAARVLESAGLKVSWGRGPSTTTVAAGKVYYQDPMPAVTVSRGDRVTVWVSAGPLGTPSSGFWRSPYPRP